MFVSAGGRKFPQKATPAFPLKPSSSGRYLIDANGNPFPVYDYAFWGSSCVSSTSDLNSWITQLTTWGITAVHMSAYVGGVICTTGTPPSTVSKDMNGNLPFLKNNDASTYTATWGGNADLSQYNDSYFSTVSTIITTLGNNGILVFFWPFYLGFGAGVQGLGSDLTNSGATKANTFATYIAGKFTHSNLIWMAYGDNVPTSTLQTVHAGAWNTLIASAAQRPLLIGGHFPSGYGDPSSPNNTDTSGATAINSIVNVRTNYDWNASTDYTSAYSNLISSCQASPVLLTLKLDPGAYEGVAGAGGVTATPNDVRLNWWWSVLSGIAGTGWANAFTQYAGSQDGTVGSFTFANGNTSSGLLSDGHKHLPIGINIHRSLPWWLLMPANVGGMGTIITSGQGAANSTAWITAAADPGGSCVAAYVPATASATFSVNMALMAAPASAYWFDPTTGAATTIAAPQSPLSNTGSHSFTTPGNNAYGAADWVLILTCNKQNQWW